MTASADAWVPEFDSEIWDEYPTWTSANAGEVLPGVLTPLTISTVVGAADHGFQYLLDDVLGLGEHLGIDGSRQHYCVGTFYGRAHLNLSLIRKASDLIPGTSAEAVDEQYMGKQRDPDAPPRVLSPEEEALSLKAGARFEAAVPEHIQATIEYEADVASYTANHLARDLTVLSDEELLSSFDETIERSRRSAELHLFNRAMESPALEGLTQFVEAVTGAADAGLVATLCTGLAEIESAKPAHELWRLSRLLVDSEEPTQLFEMTSEEIAAALNDSEKGDRRAFSAELQSFLAQYGYRGERELELSMPSWRHDPRFVISAIRGLARMTSGDPDKITERQAAARMAAQEAFEANLDDATRAQFGEVLTLTHTFLAMGERSKSQLVRDVGCGKDIIRELAQRLHQRELLSAPDDVFFLPLDELQSLVRTPDALADISEVVERRRADYARQEEIQLPEFFDGRPVPLAERSASTDVTELTGIPVSPGVVTERARVIMSVAGDTHIEEGEILIAPYTDAPWTPLFLPAAALVCDLGGPLSHGSVVAREYGIPAVTNTKQGTEVIRTGDLVTVDGAAGTVSIDRT